MYFHQRSDGLARQDIKPDCAFSYRQAPELIAGFRLCSPPFLKRSYYVFLRTYTLCIFLTILEAVRLTF